MTMPPTGELLPDPPHSLSFNQVELRFSRIVPGDISCGLVPYFHFRILAAGGADVGHINFRLGSTEHVLNTAGHIGFEIARLYRGHRYALQACRAIAPFVGSIYDFVILTCDPGNPASRRTIELLGTSFLDEVAVPPSDPHHRRGSRTKRRYRWMPLQPPEAETLAVDILQPPKI